MDIHKKVFIEKREKEGGYAVRTQGSERASAIAKTQEKAIEKAQKMHPNAAVLIERVRNTKTGGRDKWRQ